MTERIHLQPAQAFAACVQLPEREIGLARREMVNASGGVFPTGSNPVLWFIVGKIAEAIVDYFDDED